MRRALGKGLAQLLGEQGETQVTELAIEAIEPNPGQPRTIFDQDALEELADSIRKVGILQPLVVRPIKEGRYSLIAGERRWRASKLAGLEVVPVIVRTASEQSALQLAIIENVQREDITSIEEAVAYRKLIDEFNYTQELVAESVGKSRTAIANTLRLLRLPEEVRTALGERLITEGHARALLMCETSEQLLQLFYKVVDEGLTVRETERLARTQPKAATAVVETRPKRPTDPNIHAVQEAMGMHFGSPVKLKRTEKGGSIKIDFYSDEDLERILEILGIQA